jgi:predicted nicotinamide N-methyase
VKKVVVMGERASPASRRQTAWERFTNGRFPRSRPDVVNGICPSSWDELHAIVQANSPLRIERVELPGTDVTLPITRPYPVDRERYSSEPYWAYIWPSGVVLAGAIARDPSVLRGRRVLELGPGVGVTTVAALQAGADLVIADAAPESLAFCAFNALEHTGIEPNAVHFNWRMPSSELFAVAADGFSLVLAADVLYEDEDVEPLLALVQRLVAPNGELWLAEPGRTMVEELVRALRARGWLGNDEQCNSPWPDPNAVGKDMVSVHRLRRPSPSRA